MSVGQLPITWASTRPFFLATSFFVPVSMPAQTTALAALPSLAIFNSCLLPPLPLLPLCQRSCQRHFPHSSRPGCLHVCWMRRSLSRALRQAAFYNGQTMKEKLHWGFFWLPRDLICE